jgi:hypothetical protein
MRFGCIYSSSDSEGTAVATSRRRLLISYESARTARRIVELSIVLLIVRNIPRSE